MATKIFRSVCQNTSRFRSILSNAICFAKPESLSYEAASFLEPLACVVHSLQFLDSMEGGTLVVIGAGGFGLLHALVARVMGAAQVIVLARNSERLAFALELGCEHVVDTREDAALEYVREHTGGRGADAVVECTGNPSVWESAPSYARRGGIVSLFGGLPTGTSVAFDAARLHYDEVRLISPFHFAPRAVRAAFRFACGGENRSSSVDFGKFSA